MLEESLVFIPEQVVTMEHRVCPHHDFHMCRPSQQCEICLAAGESMRDVRDIVAQCDREAPPHVAEIVEGVGLRNYRGPVVAIRVSGPEAKLLIDFRVPDRVTRQPVTLTVFSGYLVMFDAWPTETQAEKITEQIRSSLHFTVTHELDECLIYRGKLVHDPHG